MSLVDTNAIMQVIGCLMKDTLLLTNIGLYSFDVDDFDTRFTKGIFGAIFNLFQNGAKTVSIVDITNYLEGYDVLFKIFEENHGIKYLQDCEELAQPANFDYYYGVVRRFGALRQLQKLGYDVGVIYPTKEMDAKKEIEMKERFHSMELEQIFESVMKPIVDLQYKYIGKNGGDAREANTGLKELKEELKLRPEIGYPLQGELFNTITRGARKGKFYLRSGSTGSGKSRTMMGDACFLAFPYRYDSVFRKWTKTGSCQKLLFITTELDFDEVQTVLMANIADVNEEHILFGKYDPGEEERVDRAIEIIEQYKENFIIESVPDPSVAQLKATIRRHVYVNQVGYVFYDYIFSSPNLLNEFRDLKVREDVALNLLSTSLKDLAKELNVFVMSGTQLSGNYDNWKGIRNQTLIRGAKSICDKIDVGAITMPVTDEELGILNQLIRKHQDMAPTHVTDIYKLRRGRYKNVRIWSQTDLGTGRQVDLFVTDAAFNFVPIPVYEIEFSDMVDDDELTDISDMQEVPESKNRPEETETVDTTGEAMEDTQEVEIVETPSKKKNYDWSEYL